MSERGWGELELAVWIQAIATVFSLVIAVKAICLSAENLKQMRIHSSPKPFIELRTVSTNTTDGEFLRRMRSTWLPCISLSNVGHGIAVDVKVFCDWATDDNCYRFELSGPSVIPANDRSDAIFEIPDNDLLPPEKLTVTILYKSDTGYERKTIWEWGHSEAGGEYYKLVHNE